MESLQGGDRARLVHDGCLYEHPLRCDVCRQEIRAGDDVHCNDGYDRVYGEFVLSEVSDLYENNWPAAHLRCAQQIDESAPAPETPADPGIPRAIALGERRAIIRVTRMRLIGAALFGTCLAAAGAAAYLAGATAGAIMLGAGAGLAIAGWTIAVRLRG